MAQKYELKPNKTVFVTYRFIKGFVYSLIFFIFLYFVINLFVKMSFLYFIIIFIVLEIFSYYCLNIRYNKEKYIFLANKIIHKAGSIFSDTETELIIKNITHVTMKLPFIQNKLFRTGSISIESAGTAMAELYLSYIDNPEQIYEYIEKLMKLNGFKLAKSKLIQQERPSSVGVFFEVFKNFIGSIFIVFLIIGYIGDSLINILMKNIALAVFIIGIILLLLFIRSISKFLDLKIRVYEIYSDTITYSEGFLSKNYSFIPIENLADSTITQTLVDKIFGLYDVKISCQGRGHEILFKNIIHGKKLESNVGSLISKTKSLVGTGKIAKKEVKVIKQAAYQKPLQKETRFTAEFKMDGKKTIVPLLIILPICLILFPLMFVWVTALISYIIKISATRYLVKPNSIEEQYDFITSKHKEFTNDKITAVTFKESFIDKWFKTCSVHFWSIGSHEDIKFTNIKKSEGLYKNILAKLGIRSQQVLYQMNSNFSVLEMFKAEFPINIFAFLVIIGCFVGLLFGTVFGGFYGLAFLIPLIVTISYYAIAISYSKIYYKRSKLKFFKDYIYFTKGIFLKEFYYVLYDNIKDIITVKYPFSKLGSIRFDIAGERIVQKGKEQAIVSNSFKINYIDDIDNKDELIDLIFYQRPNAQQISLIEQNIQTYSPKPILTAKPDLANTLTGLIIFSVVVFPFLILLPITIPLTIWGIKVKTYIIQPYRVVAKSGILYKKQISIVFNKIDHITFYQGMLNKMFKNGNITVNTTGSSKAELIIQNIPHFKEFSQVLKKYY